MIITSEESIAEVLDAASALTIALTKLASEMRRDAWITIDDACKVSGLSKRGVRYQAEKNVIRTMLPEDAQRGRFYSRFDCEMIRAGYAGSADKNKEVAI